MLSVKRRNPPEDVSHYAIATRSHKRECACAAVTGPRKQFFAKQRAGAMQTNLYIVLG
jgi:hypothetical protein